MRAVLDTNVIIAAFLSSNVRGSGQQLLSLWRSQEFCFLYSRDTLLEYAEVLLRKGVPCEKVHTFLRELHRQGEAVSILFFHLPVYPTDSDDIAFLLCALNGQADFLVSYDRHLLDIADDYRLRIVPPPAFLRAITPD